MKTSPKVEIVFFLGSFYNLFIFFFVFYFFGLAIEENGVDLCGINSTLAHRHIRILRYYRLNRSLLKEKKRGRGGAPSSVTVCGQRGDWPSLPYVMFPLVVGWHISFQTIYTHHRHHKKWQSLSFLFFFG